MEGVKTALHCLQCPHNLHPKIVGFVEKVLKVKSKETFEDTLLFWMIIDDDNLIPLSQFYVNSYGTFDSK